jgi:hypothetical protein
MKRSLTIISLLLIMLPHLICMGQDSLSFSGQASAWVHYNKGNALPFYTGGRYIPRVNYSHGLKSDRKIDF